MDKVTDLGTALQLIPDLLIDTAEVNAGDTNDDTHLSHTFNNCVANLNALFNPLYFTLVNGVKRCRSM